MNISIIDNNNTKELKDGVIELIDANNKVFNVSIDEIVDASTILSHDEKIILDDVNYDKVFSLSIVDSENNVLDEEKLISDVKSGTVSALDVTFEATHSGKNKNNVVYVSESMEKDSKSWMFPFCKPLIKNHDMHEEPIGRVVDATFSQSDFAEDRDTINVTFRVSDEDAMKKFADGRYKTMSIGAAANYMTCNVCGKDVLKDGQFKFCGHWRGESYKNQIATWTAKDLEYKEGSVVNNPADIFAQVKKIRVIKHKDGTDMANKDEENLNVDDAISDIDNLIEDEKAPEVEESVIENNDETSTEGSEVIEDNNETEAEKTPSIEDELEEAKVKISDLENQINSLIEEKKTLSDELEEKKSELERLNDSLNSTNEEIASVKDQAKRLAVFNKKLLADNLKALDNKITDEELEGKTAKEITDMIEVAKNTVRELAPTLKNPGAIVKDSNTIVEDENEPTVEKNFKTMKDMEEVIMNFFN